MYASSASSSKNNSHTDLQWLPPGLLWMSDDVVVVEMFGHKWEKMGVDLDSFNSQVKDNPEMPLNTLHKLWKMETML